MRRTHRPAVLVGLLVVLAWLTSPAGVEARPRAQSVFIGFGYYGVPYDAAPYWGSSGWYQRGWGRYPWGPYPYLRDNGSDIRIQATPREAQVYVDGYFVGLVDDFDGFSQRLRLRPGEYEIELYLEGYKTVRERVLVRPRTTVKMKHTLEPLTPGEPQPPKPEPVAGAVRRLPPTAPEPGPDPRWPRKRPAARPDGTEPGELPRRREAAVGTLSVRVQPAGAVVIVDGERWDSPDGSLITVELRAGTYEIEVQREGHRSYKRWIEIRAGETTSLNVSLPRQ